MFYAPHGQLVERVRFFRISPDPLYEISQLGREEDRYGNGDKLQDKIQRSNFSLKPV